MKTASRFETFSCVAVDAARLDANVDTRWFVFFRWGGEPRLRRRYYVDVCCCPWKAGSCSTEVSHSSYLTRNDVLEG